MADSSIKQYSRPLRNWWSFCKKNGVQFFSPTSTQALEFLAKELQGANSYSTLNTARSAISLISRNEIGNHPLVKRFCKGAGAIKPPRPRYDFVWDPAPVVAKLATIYPYSDLSLDRVSKKLALLLALITGHRVQTFSKLRISQISIADKMTIRVPDRIKTSGPGRAQPFFTFSRFTECEGLCIIRLMEHYLAITKNLRPPTCDFLFISYSRPYRAVGPQTISRWIRLALTDCGIQTDIFSAHSTRHASTSTAAKKGVSLDLIKRAAGWSGESRVFARFYDRPIVNAGDFSNSVLRP